MIDLHSHILPGVDDGPADLAGSLEIARSAVADGITVLAATPHVRHDHPTRAETMERRLVELRIALATEDVPLEVLPGGELDLEQLRGLDDEELRRFGLGGNPEWLLVEFPYGGWPLTLPQTLFDLQLRGFTPLLAHPERNREVQEAPERVAPLVDAGSLVQLTAASVDGRLGRPAQATALRLLELGLAHVLASDAHAPTVRQIGLTAAREAIGDARLATWLTSEMPGAIVRGESLPPRPRLQPRRRLGFPGRRH